MLRHTIVLLLFATSWAAAGPHIPPGDAALRQDIQRLADQGIITSPVTTWPLAWGPILSDLARVDEVDLPAGLVDVVLRVRRRAEWETRSDELTVATSLAVADDATRIRSFRDTPRGRAQGELEFDWIGNWFSADIGVQYVDDAQDDEDVRFDNSSIGVALGNWSISASTLQRWWGPGWDGSLILSNNARPFPSLSIDRTFTDAFETRWLAWLGPWDLTVQFGQLESDRFVPDTRIFAMRFNFRPLPSLEIGLSRTAQWCGDGRPCDLETFTDLFLGKDNVGDDTTRENEPGNQLAGVDARWSFHALGQSLATYAQFIGEDEAGGLPSRFLGQLGIETSGLWRDHWSYRLFAEFAGTSCIFYDDREIFNCAYNHPIYATGYRYRGRAIGHGVDNDSRVVSAGALLVNAESDSYEAIVRYGALNRGGFPDPRNSLTPLRQDFASIDLVHVRRFRFGTVEVGIGFESIDRSDSAPGRSDTRAFLLWRSDY